MTIIEKAREWFHANYFCAESIEKIVRQTINPNFIYDVDVLNDYQILAIGIIKGETFTHQLTATEVDGEMYLRERIGLIIQPNKPVEKMQAEVYEFVTAYSQECNALDIQQLKADVEALKKAQPKVKIKTEYTAAAAPDNLQYKPAER